jgi:hypothetical protein
MLAFLYELYGCSLTELLKQMGQLESQLFCLKRNYELKIKRELLNKNTYCY